MSFLEKLRNYVDKAHSVTEVLDQITDTADQTVTLDGIKSSILFGAEYALDHTHFQNDPEVEAKADAAVFAIADLLATAGFKHFKK
ncbi:MAG: hypothetical protein KC476_04445 [Cyanobacteria bacterium HKST-UBA06]|nr:hypothetical protein [Cyanobacteria bacterium HKST-UBA04]MCA9807185.1 hypothetical protein [Cyanobacteria bacterium HKST-UBA06]